MTIDFYHIPPSAPCRAVLMVLKHLDIKYEPKFIDLRVGDQNKPEFIAINPQHTIPTIVDDGFSLWESRAIMQYLCNKYAPKSTLYPTDPKERATIDRLLNFDLGTLYKAQADAVYPLILQGAKEIEPEKEKTLKEKLTFLDGFLANSSGPYLTGDCITIADLSIYATIGLLDFVDYDYTAFANVTSWKQKMSQELPYDKEVNQEPTKMFKEAMKNLK